MGASATAIIGLAGGAISASAQRQSAIKAANAYDEAAGRMFSYAKSAASPFYTAGVKAVGDLQNLAGFYAGRLGGSQYLQSQQALTIDDIIRSKRQGMAASESYWAKGNVGRGRGEQMRIDAQALGAMSNARVGYGVAQENFIGQNAQQYAGLLGSLGNMGMSSFNALIGANKEAMGASLDAAKLRMAGDDQLTGLASGAFGKVFGYGLDAYMQDKFPELFKSKNGKDK